MQTGIRSRIKASSRCFQYNKLHDKQKVNQTVVSYGQLFWIKNRGFISSTGN